MKYLKRVILKNFQSHKNSIIDFNEGLNIIVGPSDSGKSAIIRAIKWALYNEPSGNYFIREGETEASVILEFSNNIKIKRLRNKSKNAYILYNIDGEEITFEGFGNKVPQEIIDLLEIKKISLDSNESNAINLGEQLEGAFLLSEKGSTRASAIGRLIGVNLIDDALKETLKDIRNISIQKNTISESIKTIQEELITYEYLDNLKEGIIELDNIRNNIKKKINLKDIFTKTLEVYKIINKEKEYINEVVFKLNELDILEDNIYRLENKNIKLILYKNINNLFYENKEQIIYNESLINNLINVNFIESIVLDINNLRNKLEKLKSLKMKIDYYKIELQNIYLINRNLKDIDLIKEKIDIMEIKINKTKNLNSIKERLDSVNSSLNTGKSYIRELKDLDEIDILFKQLENMINKKHLIVDLSTKFYNYRSGIENQNIILKDIKKNTDYNLKKYENLLIKSETCPFCLSNINEDKIEHIIAHYS